MYRLIEYFLIKRIPNSLELGCSLFYLGKDSFTKQSKARTKYLAALKDADRNYYNSLTEFSRL